MAKHRRKKLLARAARADGFSVSTAASPGLFVAAGHYRNGILLAPITARIIADLMLCKPLKELHESFAPARLCTAV